MRTTWSVIGIAAPFVWVGMVAAISFIEAPLKFRAPGVSLPVGVGIGRLVFRALNVAEVGLAGLLTVTCAALGPPLTTWVLLVAGWSLLALQLGVLRPHLDRRARVIIGGCTPAASPHHLVYVALEVAKLPLLVVLGASVATAVLP